MELRLTLTSVLKVCLCVLDTFPFFQVRLFGELSGTFTDSDEGIAYFRPHPPISSFDVILPFVMQLSRIG